MSWTTSATDTPYLKLNIQNAFPSPCPACLFPLPYPTCLFFFPIQHVVSLGNVGAWRTISNTRCPPRIRNWWRSKIQGLLHPFSYFAQHCFCMCSWAGQWYVTLQWVLDGSLWHWPLERLFAHVFFYRISSHDETLPTPILSHYYLLVLLLSTILCHMVFTFTHDFH